MARKIPDVNPKHPKLNTPQVIITHLETVVAFGYDMRQVFRDWVSLCECTLLDLPHHVAMALAEKRVLEPHEESPQTQELFVELQKRYGKKWPEAFEAFTDAFTVLVNIAEREGITDILGPLHQELILGNAKLGQFFTPWALSDTMAQISDPTADVHARMKQALSNPKNPWGHVVLMGSALIEDGNEAERYFHEKVIPAALPFFEPITVHDPCVGSGANLLAIAANVPAWANQYGLVRYCGQDIDQLCVQMSRVQLKLFGLRGIDLPQEQTV